MGYMYPFPKSIGKSQPYGANPNNGINPPKGHNGDDWLTPVGTAVRAACDGYVVFSQWFDDTWGDNIGWNTSGGGLVLWIINDAGTLYFEYGHLSQSLVKAGQRITKGQVVATTGNSGASSGPHCHVGVMPTKPDMNNGSYGRINPENYFDEYYEDRNWLMALTDDEQAHLYKMVQDIWWRNCDPDGIAENNDALLDQAVKREGRGAAISGDTSLRAVIANTDDHTIRLLEKP